MEEVEEEDLPASRPIGGRYAERWAALREAPTGAIAVGERRPAQERRAGPVSGQ